MKLEQIQIPNPCSPQPGVLRGSGPMLFCSDCQKHVHDLSQMSREAGEQLVSGGNVCVQFSTTRDGRVLTREPLSRRQWLTRSLAAAMAWISLGAILTGCRSTRTRGTPQPPPQRLRGEMMSTTLAGRVAPATQPTTQSKLPRATTGKPQ